MSVASTSSLITLLFLSTQSFGQSNSCPSSAKAWNEWRTNALEHLRNPSDAITLSKTLKECSTDQEQNSLFASPEFKACMKPILDMAEFESADSSAGYGSENLSIPVNEYSNPKRVVFPELIDAPEELKMADLKSEESVMATLTDLRKKYPKLEAIERKPGNIVVWIPGSKFDRWINITAGMYPNFLYIGIQKTDKNGKELDPPKSFFNAYRSKDATLYMSATSAHPTSGPKSNSDQKNELEAKELNVRTPMNPAHCVKCHRTGAMPLFEHTDSDHPLHAAFATENVTTVQQKIIDAIANTANAKPDSVVNVGFGPPMGEVKTVRTPDFIQGCANGKLTDQQIANVQKGMKCATCHDDSMAGIITAPIDGDLLRGLVRNGHMPPDADDPKSSSYLTPVEREVVYRCLGKEYYGPDGTTYTSGGTLIKSFLAKSCPTQDLPFSSVTHQHGNKDKSPLPTQNTPAQVCKSAPAGI